MGRQTADFNYGDCTFLVKMAGGTDGMDAAFILAQGALPAIEQVLKDAKGLATMMSSDIRKSAEALLWTMPADTEAKVQSPGAEKDKGKSVLDMDTAALAPILQGLQRAMKSLPQEDRDQLRKLLLFNGAITVIHPDNVPGGSGRVSHVLDRALWDELFQGDPLGAWYVFGRIIWFNVGKSSPAIDAFRKRPTAGEKKNPSGSAT